jgi:hypothetical protein
VGLRDSHFLCECKISLCPGIFVALGAVHLDLGELSLLQLLSYYLILHSLLYFVVFYSRTLSTLLILKIFESEPVLPKPGLTPPTPQALPNILESELLSYRFCSVGGVGGFGSVPGSIVAVP